MKSAEKPKKTGIFRARTQRKGLAEQTGVTYDEREDAKRLKHRVVLGRVIIGVFLFAGWELFSKIGWLDSYYWSSPSTIVKTAVEQMIGGTLLRDIAYTSGSTIIGFVLGTFLGSALGLSFWWSKTYAGVSEPYIIIFNALPKLALGPVLIIMFGIGFASKVALAFFMTVVASALSAFSGVKSVDPAMETLMYSLGAKRRQVFTKVVVPWSMPWIISCLRINIALALAGSIVGEFIASDEGVGRMIIYAGTILDINLVWVGVFVLSILSMLMYWCVVLLEKWLSKRLIITHS